MAAAIIATALVGLLGQTSASADWYYPLVRITCVPKVGYAAVETLGLYNVETAYLADQGFVDLGVLAQNPVKCELPQGTVLFEIVDYHAPQSHGVCGGVADATLGVSLAGKEVALAKSTHGGCQGSRRHDIRISQYEVHHCILMFAGETQVVGTEDFTKVETQCKNQPLP